MKPTTARSWICRPLPKCWRKPSDRRRAHPRARPDGGTTLTAAVLIGDLAHIAHVGDSRAYLYTPEADGEEERLEQLTRDHSVAKRLEEIGHITREEADHHPEASRLWKIMGLTDNLEPDISTRRLPPGSQFVLCSDGLWNMVPDEELIAVLSTATTPQEAADILVAAANAHGGSDNILSSCCGCPARTSPAGAGGLDGWRGR